MMSFSYFKFRGVKGVGSIEVSLNPRKKVHAFIGENGVGKTKFIESMFQTLISAKKIPNESLGVSEPISQDIWVLSEAEYDNNVIKFPKETFSLASFFKDNTINRHDYPIIFMASQNRGFIQHSREPAPVMGNFYERQSKYLASLFVGMRDNFSSLNMKIDIERWFIMIAQSSNPYQRKEDNRKIEIDAVLQSLHKIDNRINNKYMEIDGNNRVFIEIDGKITQLSHLSTGFSSILKIIQSIVSGYGYFTNESDILLTEGIVLIDEIESHLHISWQSKIINLLKQLFPNTIFYVTTHSSIVLTQLDDGEAHRLQKNKDGVIHSSVIPSPGQAAFIDVLKDAFNLDLNKNKYDRMSSKKQIEAKRKLLNLIGNKVP